MDEMEIAKTIAQQIKYPDIRKYMCWGGKAFTCLPSGKVGEGYTLGGLAFKVSGMKLKGRVEILLMGDDTYTVRFFNLRYRMVKEMVNVYCDEIQEKIDETIEKIETYAY